MSACWQHMLLLAVLLLLGSPSVIAAGVLSSAPGPGAILTAVLAAPPLPTTRLPATTDAGATTTTVDGHVLQSAVDLQAQINASIAVGSAGFVIPAGAYYFDNGAPLIIYRAKNWSLTSDGHVELWFKVSQHWSTGGVLILECTDISIDGITVDYDPPTHYQGTVLNTNADRANGMVSALVRTDQGFPDPYEYVTEHTGSNDPSNNYMNAPAIWPKHIGYGCNRTLGCPGHGAAVLLPHNSSHNSSLPANVAPFMLLASARPGDKISISMRKGITWHVQNSTRVSSTNISIHSASLFGLSEFDGGGAHRYSDVWLGRRQRLVPGQLCGRSPGRLCFGVLASNADAFHSSGCKAGPALHNVTLSNNFDDFLNVHSRMQLLGDILGPNELIILDPRLQVAQGVPDDTPYGASETLPNARPGDVLEFHALNTFVPHGVATIASLERVADPTAIAKYGAAAVDATSGRPPHSMHPAMNGNVAPDVGQFCGAFADEYHLPAKCKSRVWKVTLEGAVPAGAAVYDIVSLRGWDNAGLEVVNSHFFGGIDGIHSKSNGARFENNSFACTGFDVSPWQHYLEGPPHLFGMTVVNNTFTACGGTYGTFKINCTGLNNGTDLPTYPHGDGFCNGVGGQGVMIPTTCDMNSMTIKDNHPPVDCTIFDDPGAQSTCCSACGPRCHGCD